MGRTQISLVALIAAAAALAAIAIFVLQPFGGDDGRATAVTYASSQGTPDSLVGPSVLLAGGQAALCRNRLSEVPAGQDVFESTAEVDGSIDPDGPGPLPLIPLIGIPFQSSGPTVITRGAPGDANGNGRTDIQVEIVAMSLTGSGITITESPTQQSMGMVESMSGDAPSWDSFFDVFTEISVNNMNFTAGPVRMAATIAPDAQGKGCLPPLGQTYQPPPNTPPVPIRDNLGQQVGQLTHARHVPERPRSIDVIKLDEPNKQPRAGAVVTLHSGFGCLGNPLGAGVTGIDGQFTFRPLTKGQYSVKEQTPPLGLGADLSGNCTDVDHTGPYPDASQPVNLNPPPAPGTDSFPSCGVFVAQVGTQTATVEMEGDPLNPTVVRRGMPDPITGTIPIELVALSLQSIDPLGVQVQLNPAQPSTGSMTRTPMAPLGTYDSTLNVWPRLVFTNPPLTLTTQQPVPLQSTAPSTQTPPFNRYLRADSLHIPLLDPLNQPVGILTLAIHKPKPPGEKCVIIRNPPGPPERIVFSIEQGGPTAYPSASGTRHPADILTLGATPPPVFRTCLSLGLVGCGTTAPLDDLRALSDGLDFLNAKATLPPKVFSVDTGSVGVPGTAVNVEATCPLAEPNADDFLTALTGSNGPQEYDGNGAPCGANSGFPKGLVEPLGPPSGDDQDALTELHGNDPWYFALAPSSPSLTGIPAIGTVSPAHILRSSGGVVSIYATPPQLGLTVEDKIDGLCLLDKDGDGKYGLGIDIVRFSLDTTSLTLGLLSLTPAASRADQYRPPLTAAELAAGLPVRVNTAADHGLLVTDNLDAMKCPRATDANSNGIPDPIDTGGGGFTAGNITGTLTGAATLAVVNSVEVTATGSATIGVTCPDGTLYTFATNDGNVVVVGCAGSSTVAVASGPISISFGSFPFTATVPTGVTVIVDLLSGPDCTPAARAGAYRITHSAGVGNVPISSPIMSPVVTLTPGGMFQDCDADGMFGAPGPDNCPTVPTPWVVPLSDPDCDGFTSARETFLTTDPNNACAVNNVANNEGLPDRWPFDFDDNQRAALADVLGYIPVFNSIGPNPPYNPRYDLNQSGGITLADVLSYIPVFNLTCIPPP